MASRRPARALSCSISLRLSSAVGGGGRRYCFPEGITQVRQEPALGSTRPDDKTAGTVVWWAGDDDDRLSTAGGSLRTLQRHVAQVLGLAPHAVVQKIRLAAARQTLLSGEVISVLDVALRHGFNHPGRFAIAYTRAFGQPPSATLRAARAQAP